MSKGHHVKIVTPKLGQSGVQVFIDGEEITRVLSAEFICSADSYPIATIKFWPESVEVEGEMMVETVE